MKNKKPSRSPSKSMDVPEIVIVRVEQTEPGKEPKTPICKPVFYVERERK